MRNLRITAHAPSNTPLHTTPETALMLARTDAMPGAARFSPEDIPTLDISNLKLSPYSRLVEIYKRFLFDKNYDATVYPFSSARSSLSTGRMHFDSLALAKIYGGANCVGLSMLLRECLNAALKDTVVQISLVASTLPAYMKQPGFPEYCHAALAIKCRDKKNNFIILFDPAFYFKEPILISQNIETKARGIGGRDWSFFWKGGNQIKANVSEGTEAYYYRLNEILNPDEAITLPITLCATKLHFIAHLREKNGLEHLVLDPLKGSIRVKYNNLPTLPPAAEGLDMGNFMHMTMKLGYLLSTATIDIDLAAFEIIKFAEHLSFKLSIDKAKALVIPSATLLGWGLKLLNGQEPEFELDELIDCLYKITTTLEMEITKEGIADFITSMATFLNEQLCTFLESFGITEPTGLKTFMSRLAPEAHKTFDFFSEEMELNESDFNKFLKSWEARNDNPDVPQLDGFNYQEIDEDGFLSILAIMNEMKPEELKAFVDNYQEEHEDDCIEIAQEISVVFLDSEFKAINWDSYIFLQKLTKILRRPVLIITESGTIGNFNKLDVYTTEPLLFYYKEGAYRGVYLPEAGQSSRELIRQAIEPKNPFAMIIESRDPMVSAQNQMAMALSLGSGILSARLPAEDATDLRADLRTMLRWYPGDREAPSESQITLRNRELTIPFSRYVANPEVLNTFLAKGSRIFHRVMNNPFLLFAHRQPFRNSEADEIDDQKNLCPRFLTLINYKP